jgi:hypothetical protein
MYVSRRFKMLARLLSALLLCVAGILPAGALELTQSAAFSGSVLGDQSVDSGWAKAEFSALSPAAGTLNAVTVTWDFDITSDSSGSSTPSTVYTRAEGPLRINGVAYDNDFVAELFAGSEFILVPIQIAGCNKFGECTSCARTSSPSTVVVCEYGLREFGKQSTQHVTTSKTFIAGTDAKSLALFSGTEAVRLLWDAPLVSIGNTAPSGIAGTVTLDYLYAAPVPEPASVWLIAAGLALFAIRRTRVF